MSLLLLLRLPSLYTDCLLPMDDLVLHWQLQPRRWQP